MAVLYLTEQGSLLHKEGEVLVVRKEGRDLVRVPARQVDQVVVFGAVGLTTQAMVFLLSQGIDCVFCSSTGRYHGRLVSSESGMGALRLRQALAVVDGRKALSLARAFVRGKVANQRTILLRFARLREGVVEAESSAQSMADLLGDLERVRDLETLRGLEGQASALYFRGFRSLLKTSWGFEGRRKRPPPDPVNSLLSLGYTLLGYAVQNAVQVVGLDPFLGFLHPPYRSRPGLVLDLMEEFRPVLVDSLVLALLNRGLLEEHHFTAGVEEPGGVFLSPEGLRRFLPYFQARLEERVTSPVTGERVSYRRVLEHQARLLARVLLGSAPAYRSYLIR